MMRDRWLERGSKKQGKCSDSCHFSDQCFLVFYLKIQPSWSKTRMDIST